MCCHNEAVATNTIYSDTPTIDNGAIAAQFYVAHKSLFCEVYGMKSDKEFINTLEDSIHVNGAMDAQLSDWVQVEISAK